MTVVNFEKRLWLENVGVVPKFVAYFNYSAMNDTVNQVLLANNYYPASWSLDPQDFINTEAQIKTTIGPAVNDVIIVNEFVQSNFSAATLQWFYNNTKASFNTLQTCFGTNSLYWNNCTADNNTVPLNSPAHSPLPSTTPVKTPSTADKLSWIFLINFSLWYFTI